MNKEQRIKDLAEVRKSNNPDAVLVAKINDLREQAFNLIKKLEDKTVEKTDSVLADLKATHTALEDKINEELKRVSKDKDYSDDYFKKELQTLKNVIADVRAKKVDRIIEKTEVIREVPNPIDTARLASEASEMALEATKELIQAIPPITDDLPKYAGIYRDALETLKDDDRLSASAIKDLPEFVEKTHQTAAFGVREAPRDGKTYGRNNRAWVEVEGDTDEKVKLNALDATAGYLDAKLQEGIQAVQFDVTNTPLTSAPGLIQWNTTDGTYDMGLLNSSVLQVGQETMFYGKASGAIANGDLCQFAGVQGDHILIKKAVGSEIEANPHYLVGVATENIANGAFGYVTWFGKVNGVYTKTPANQDSVDWVAGDLLYFNVTTGQLTKTLPTVPNRVITVAAVIKAQTGSSESGIIIVRPTFGCKVTDLDDVNGTPLTTTGQFLSWNQTAGYFDFDDDILAYYDGTAGHIKTSKNNPSDLNIDCGTDKTLVLGESVWDDIIISPSNLRGGVSVPNFSAFQNGVYQLLFINTQSDEVYGSFEIPHDYKEGTDLQPHIHWSPNSTNTGNCVWDFEYTIADPMTTFPATTTTTITQAGSGTINQHQLANTAAVISGSGIKVGAICVFRLARPTGDAFTGDAFLHSVGVHYQIDTIGSRQITTK